MFNKHLFIEQHVFIEHIFNILDYFDTVFETWAYAVIWVI